MRKSGNKSIKKIFFSRVHPGATLIRVLALVFLCGWVGGCGLKSDPVPPGLVIPPAVGDLAVAITPAGNRLIWTMPVGVNVARIRIFRSELLVAGDSCPGCPRDFRLVADPMPRDLAREEGSPKVAYVDTGVQSGILYTYTIRLCDSSGYCGPESNKAEVKYRPPGSVNP